VAGEVRARGGHERRERRLPRRGAPLRQRDGAEHETAPVQGEGEPAARPTLPTRGGSGAPRPSPSSTPQAPSGYTPTTPPRTRARRCGWRSGAGRSSPSSCTLSTNSGWGGASQWGCWTPRRCSRERQWGAAQGAALVIGTTQGGPLLLPPSRHRSKGCTADHRRRRHRRRRRAPARGRRCAARRRGGRRSSSATWTRSRRRRRALSTCRSIGARRSATPSQWGARAGGTSCATRARSGSRRLGMWAHQAWRNDSVACQWPRPSFVTTQWQSEMRCGGSRGS